MAQSIQRRMATGAIWMVLFKFVERGLGLISTLILARLLGPTDFGIVAMAISFIAMAELLTAFGFDIAIIQTPQATVEHYNTAWTCNVLLNLGVAVLMLALAVPIAEFYRKPEVIWVVVALAFGPLIAGAENIGVVAFRKDLDFKREFRFQLSRKLIGFAVVIPLALLLRNYWALVAGMLASKVAGTAMSYWMHPFRPRFALSKFKELFRFSRWLLFNNLVGFFKERSTDFFIGRLYGPASLGSYNVAYELAHLPTTEIGAPINRALLPGFAKMNPGDEVARAYASAVGVLAMLALPAAAVMFVVSPFLVPVLLGSKWLSAVPVMQVLAFNGALMLFHASISTVLMGRGFSKQVGFANACYLVVLVVFLVLFSEYFGVVGAAYAALLTTLVCSPVYLHYVHRCLGVRARVIFEAVSRPLAAALVTALVLQWMMPGYDAKHGVAVAAAWLVGGMMAGTLLYTALALLLWTLMGRPGGAEQVMIDRARAFVAQRWGVDRAAKQQQP